MMGVFWLFDREKEVKRKFLICSILLIFGFFISSSPYLVFLHNQTGQWTLSEKGGYNLKYIKDFNEDPLKYEEKMSGLTDNGTRIKGEFFLSNEMEKVDSFNYVIQHSNEIAKRYTINLSIVYSRTINSVLPPLLIFLTGYGLFRRKWTKERFKKELYLIVIIIYPLLLYPVFGIENRYLLPILPIAIIWSANGINELQDWLNQTTTDLKIDRLRQGFIFKNIVFIVISLSLIPMIALIPFYFYSDQPVEHKTAGLWMKENEPLKPVIMEAKRPYVAFYAEGTHIPMPYANYTEMMKYAKHHNVNYIIIDEIETTKVRPQLAFLLDETKAPEGELKLIYKDNNQRNKILIYKLQ
jgi:hypothetical protein